MKIIVYDEKKDKIEKNTENTEKTENTENNDIVKWWTPFECKKKGTLTTNSGQIGMGCGSRACYECHRKKLYKSVSTLTEMKRYKHTSMYSLVFTPKERVKTHDDVSKFLSSFRGLLRKWQRTHDMKFGYWVAECVIKDNEQHTNIPCPIRQYTNPEYNEITDTLQKQCRDENKCYICRGTGYLPSTHLHIHFVVCCPSFYFGQGETPEHLKSRKFYDFGGLGFYGFCQQNNMGVSRCELLKSTKDMTEYISKACLVYMAKVQKDKDDSSGHVDWAETQRGVMIASYTYGRKRHRGSCGDAYGITTTTKDYTNYVSFHFDPPNKIEKNACDVLFGHIPEKADKTDTNGGRYIDVMTIGLKAQKNIDGVIDLNNVLKKTKLDIQSIIQNSTYIFRDGNIYQAPTMISKTLTAEWTNTAVVSKTSEYLIFGRGSTILSVPKEWLDIGGYDYLKWLMEFIYFFDYSEWYSLLRYPFDN